MDGIWPPLFENSNSTYANAVTDLSEEALVFFRKVINNLSKTLAKAV